MQLILTIVVCFVASATGKMVSNNFQYRVPFKLGFENSMKNLDPSSSSSSSSSLAVKKDFVGVDIRGGGKTAVAKPPAFLKWAYGAVGLATSAVSKAWSLS